MTALLALLAGCTEYRIHSPGKPVYGEGNPPGLEDKVQVDRVRAVEQSRADLLFVVDNSCSMYDDQERLISNVPSLVAGVNQRNVDFHIGVTTTDCRADELCGNVDWISSESGINLVLGTGALIAVGISGTDVEEGSQAIWAALHKAEDENAGFFRPDVPLHIVIISDERDFSGNANAERLGDYLSAERATRGVLTVSTIVRPTATDHMSGCHAEYPPTYLDLTAQFPGEVVDICADDWDPVMDRIAEGFLDTSNRRFPLSRVPVRETLTVMVETDDGITIVPAGTEWTYDRSSNTVELDEVLNEFLGTAILTYEIAE